MAYQWNFWKTALGHHRCEPRPKWIISSLLKTSLKSMYSLHLYCSHLHLCHQSSPGLQNICSPPGLLASILAPSPNCSLTRDLQSDLSKHMPHYTTVLLQILSCVCISLRIKLELHHGLSCLTPIQPTLIPILPFPSLQPN